MFKKVEKQSKTTMSQINDAEAHAVLLICNNAPEKAWWQKKNNNKKTPQKPVDLITSETKYLKK